MPHRHARFRIRSRVVVAVLVGLATLCSALIGASSASALTAGTVAPDPKVGGILLAGQAQHFCTGSVVASPRHDLVLTAAHCVVGDGHRLRFVPGLDGSSRPYGTWPVTRVYLRPEWIGGHDDQHDYAFLEVAPIRWHGALRRLQDVVGANRIAAAPANGQRVAVTGYVAGTGGRPIRCRTSVYYRGAYPAFDCHGYHGGVSGSPWVDNGVVRAVIGGLRQGGCVESTSYSSQFDADLLRLYRRASAGYHPNVAPAPTDDGC
ncbi:MAG: trypsin-like serine peptidase [Jatrophihabitans sp.]|uniref:trypsin-like serine peptidase n=1 Tax=Jatrophihabitans sp. TaxID=1932789 RepID=UPI003F7F06FF